MALTSVAGRNSQPICSGLRFALRSRRRWNGKPQSRLCREQLLARIGTETSPRSVLRGLGAWPGSFRRLNFFEYAAAAFEEQPTFFGEPHVARIAEAEKAAIGWPSGILRRSPMPVTSRCSFPIRSS
ncbi:hypothetical protein AGR8A_pAt30154 [Agrobacterium fabrum str. J-07]|nr:hypothetical protein AGR8A_pAt30154 [Agrobacterium fabrum str. J-07]